MFAIVDVETTGGFAENHRVIEVGIAISNGTTIIERYNQLINPGRSIPLSITQLTGISNEDVREAPTFSEVASRIFELLQGQVFVAHNVNFDFTFIQRELSLAGYSFKAKKLCTVRSARKVFPGLKSYSLGKLAAHFKIVNPNPHRALADAETAAHILHRMLQENEAEVTKQYSGAKIQLPIHLEVDLYNALPEQPGVYYLKDEKGSILYIGKAVNIKKRIAQHFSGLSGSKRRQEWLREVRDIQFKLTGSEALALFHEDHEIRHHWPPYNSAQKHPIAKWGIVAYADRKGVLRLAAQRAENRVEVIESHFSLLSAQQSLAKWVTEFELNPQYCGLGWPSDISAEDHSNRLSILLAKKKELKSSIHCMLFPAVEPNEYGYVLLKGGEYKGIGITTKSPDLCSLPELESHLWHSHSSPTTQQIVNQLLQNHRLHEMKQHE